MIDQGYGLPSHSEMESKTAGFTFSGENESFERAQWTSILPLTPNKTELMKRANIEKVFPPEELPGSPRDFPHP